MFAYRKKYKNTDNVLNYSVHQFGVLTIITAWEVRSLTKEFLLYWMLYYRYLHILYDGDNTHMCLKRLQSGYLLSPFLRMLFDVYYKRIIMNFTSRPILTYMYLSSIVSRLKRQTYGIENAKTKISYFLLIYKSIFNVCLIINNIKYRQWQLLRFLVTVKIPFSTSGTYFII